jgi:hypothetical protein
MKNLGYFIVEQEIAEKAVAAHRARQVREKRRLGREQARRPGLGRGARVLTREEAVAHIAKKSRRGAQRLLAGYVQRIPEKRGECQ